jgi:hypothetical protein
MTQEMNMEAVEVITMAVDKFIASKNYEVRPSWRHSLIGWGHPS